MLGRVELHRQVEKEPRLRPDERKGNGERMLKTILSSLSSPSLHNFRLNDVKQRPRSLLDSGSETVREWSTSVWISFHCAKSRTASAAVSRSLLFSSTSSKSEGLFTFFNDANWHPLTLLYQKIFWIGLRASKDCVKTYLPAGRSSSFNQHAIPSYQTSVSSHPE